MVSYSIDEAPMYKKYQNEAETLLTSSLKVVYAHEAGFDAYMTGCVFLSTAKYREIGCAMEQQKLLKKSAEAKNKNKCKKKRREMKAEDKDTGSNSQNSGSGNRQFWSDIRGEKVDLLPMDEFKNKIVLDLNDRYFDFSENFNGKEQNFDTSSVVWIRWCKREAPTHSQENWNKNKIEYEKDKTEIIVSRLAEILSAFGDVSIVKDSSVSAFVEFTSYDPKNFKRTANKDTVFQNKSVLKDIQKCLEEETGIESFEVFKYEEAEKFSAKFIHE